jgi:phosphatidylserine/phosphatidylglycerophosphate/cardiolipin synthase-like enzyme
LADSKQISAGADELLDLVLSGPDIPGTATRDTAAVAHALLSEAAREVLLVGYAIHNARHIFQPLAVRMNAVPGLRVWCCFDIRRPLNDTTPNELIVRRFADDFSNHHWPWSPKPEIYYDPRSLEIQSAQRASLQAKCVVVDRKAALVTSANFTEAAQTKNVECGVIVRYAPFADRIARYFEGLCSGGGFERGRISAS